MPPPDASAFDDAVEALFARQPSRMEPGLDRILTLAELLGRPDQAYPSIQVTGTNGKGSTTGMVAGLLGAMGLSAGTYTSPHLQDVRERVRVASEPISKDAFTAALDYLAPFLAEVDARHPQRMSFFEVLTAISFNHFADAPVDVGVFEVGMGGRWDATNLVRGEVAVLTRVGVDHPELGDRAEVIAEEKLGVVKPGAVVVSAEQEPAVAALVTQTAERHDARLVTAGRDFAIESRALAVGGQMLRLRGVTGTHEDIYLPLHGRHQAANAACALAAVEGFLGFAGGIDSDVVREGFASVRMPGRLEVVRRTDAATVILDAAHNPGGAQALADALQNEFVLRHRVLVIGMLGDKDVEASLDALLPVTDHLIVTEPPSARAAPAERLAKFARAAGHRVEVAPDVATAIELASGVATEEDAVVVAGSLYTVGAARDALGLEPA